MPSLVTRFRRTAAFYRLLYRDTRTPMLAKLLPFLALLYFLSPLDIIPDFVPLAGQMDDLIVVLSFIAAAIRLIPPHVHNENRMKADVIG